MSLLRSKNYDFEAFLSKKGNSRYLRQKRETFDRSMTEEGHSKLRPAVKEDFHFDV